MKRYYKCEIEMSPHLLKKLFEFVKDPKITAMDFHWIVDNLIELGKCDELLTLDEFELATRKPGIV